MTDARPALIIDAHDPGPSGLGRYAKELTLALAMRGDFRRIYLVGDPGDLDAWRVEAATPLEIVPFPYKRYSPFVPLRWRRALRHISAQPNIITWFPHYDGAWTASPCVTTLHDVIHFADRSAYGRLRSYVIKQWMRRMIAASRFVITPTQGSADAICAVFPEARGKMTAVHHGVADVFHAAGRGEFDGRPVSEPGVPPRGARYLLTVANKMPHKRLETAIRAFARLAAADAELRLVMVGPRQAHVSQLRRLARALGVADRVDDVEGLSDLALAQVYRGAQALLVTSREEGFGLVVIEAMAAGTPVVIVDVPALVEVAGAAAQVVPVDDDAAMAAALRNLEFTRWRAAGLDRAREFTWVESARRTSALLVAAV